MNDPADYAVLVIIVTVGIGILIALLELLRDFRHKR